MENQKTTDPQESGQKTEPYPLSIGMEPTALRGNPRPDLNGQRIQDPRSTYREANAIYLVDEGMLRWIPNPGTYENLFRDWSGIRVDHQLVTEIPEATPLPDGACLVIPAYYDSVWLIDANQKRHVASPEVMEKYHFNWNRIYTIPPVCLTYLPLGHRIY